MSKKLGFWSIVLLTINSIIGSGIFISPGSVVKMAGTYTPIVYVAAAIFASLLALSFASAAKYVSKGGAAYAYARTAFGRNVGFYVGITRFIAASIAWGVMATSVVKTVLAIMKLDSSNFGLLTLGFIILMALLLVINLLGPKIFAIINNLSTIGKLLALLTIIIFGVYILISTGANHFLDVNNFQNANGQPLISSLNTSTFVMATITAFYALNGFESIASGSNDMQQPEKNLPKALPLGMLIIALIYIGIVSISMMINPHALVFSNQVVALVDIFDNGIVKNIVLYGALISMFGINVASSFHTPRVLEAIAKEKQIPAIFAKRNQQNIPFISFLVTIVIAIVIPMAFQYNMTNIIIISTISRFVQFIVVPLSVMMFFYGKNTEKTLSTAKRNLATDVIVPVISLVLTAFLLFKFDWVGQFSIVDATGSHLNLYAISAMIIGYVILPIVLYLFNRKSKTSLD
ncbi:APC family permease [Holzapfeliella sp. He02]|uniref:APC family permease n=1 Tax=Holzapfeliella saturejae TaxID=3082953 RepID=A0ABU8SEE3_9LACO